MLLLPLVNLGLGGGAFQLPDQGVTRRRTPRVVVAIMFDIESIYLTSHEDMTNVPGVVIEGCIEGLSSSSQQLFPDEGRVTIGSMTITVADLAGTVTDELRSQFSDNLAAARGREVRVFEGESDDFLFLTRQETYVVDSVDFDQGSYTINCSDRAREIRHQIFDQAKTRLRATLGASDTLLQVQATDGFEMMQHTDSFSHAPGETIGYVRVKKTGEVIGYTGIQPDSFTGLYRGLFGTLAQEVTFDSNAELDRQPEIEEFIYLEMTAPEAAYAIMTGRTFSGIALPSTWNTGVAADKVRLEDFQGIGEDLYDAADPDGGLIVQFTYLSRTEGKRFVEEELHLLMGTFSPIDEYGVIGLRRLTRAISSSAGSFVLDTDHVISHGALEHVQSAVVNSIDVEWNYDGQAEEYTRRSPFLNLGSISVYREVQTRSFSFRGLTVRPHTGSTLRRFFHWMTDRYGGHPIRMQVQASMLARAVRVGDVVRAVLPHVRDFTTAATLSRAMEVQERSINHLTGEIDFMLAGSAELATEPPSSSVPPISDGWYSSAGTPLTSVLTISGGAVTANGTVTGGDDLRDAVFYYVGNLTINAGVTVNLDDNVQLRILGSLTVEGTLNGLGRGLDALTAPSTVSELYEWWPPQQVETTFGTTRSGDGLSFVSSATYLGYSPGGNFKRGLPAVPQFDLRVANGALEGLPAELRGTPGVQGAPVVERGATTVVRAVGSAGGAGGAGLAIITRSGLFFGANGEINLSGGNGTAPGGGNTVTLGGNQLYAGAGGGGAPGALLVVLDGGDVPLPDYGGGSHVASRGSTTPTGNPIEFVPTITQGVTPPWRGLGGGFSAEDLSAAARLTVWAPLEGSSGESVDEIVPVPTIAGIDTTTDGALVRVADLPAEAYDVIEIFAALDNNLSNAVRVASGTGAAFAVALGGVFTRWYWARARRGARYSAWSSAPTAGAYATAGFPIVPPTSLSNTFVETFDSYPSVHNVFNDWYVYVNGVLIDPSNVGLLSVTLQINTGGVNGGKILRIVSGANVRLVYKRPVPFHAADLYRVELRSRRAASFGDDTVWCGFFSLGNDGAQIHEGGTFATGTPTWAVLSNFSAGHVFGTSWVRTFAWISDAHASAQGTGPGDGMSSQYINNVLVGPWSPVALRRDGSGNPPAYIVPVIHVLGSVFQEIDYLRVDRVLSDPLLAGIADGNFSSTDDAEFWTAYPLQSGVMPELDLGAGPSGGNALLFRSVSSAYQLTAFARNPIRLNGNTVTVAFEYKITDNTGGSPGINASSSIRFHLYGIKAGSTVRRRYQATSTGSVTVSTLMSALTTNGTWARATVTFSNVYSSSMTDADGFLLACDYRGVGATENFHGRIGRIRVLQT